MTFNTVPAMGKAQGEKYDLRNLKHDGHSVDVKISTRFNKTAIHATPQMSVDKVAVGFSRVRVFFSK